MKRKFALFSAICLSSIAFGQAIERGNFNIDIDGAVGFYTGTLEFEYQGESDKGDLDPGYSAYANLNAAYSITDMFSFGVNYKIGSFIIKDFEADKNILNEIGLQGRVYIVNKDKFTLDVNAVFGLPFINQQDYDSGGSSSTIKWKGSDIGAGVEFNLFFTDNIGLNAGVQYNMYNLVLRGVYYNGESIELNGLTYKVKYFGPEFKLGLTVKI